MTSKLDSFEEEIRSTCTGIADFLILKNRSYGNSAMNPIQIFSKASSIEQIDVRIDDKLKRIANGHEYPGDDTVKDLIGYLILRVIVKKFTDRLKSDESEVLRKEERVQSQWERSLKGAKCGASNSEDAVINAVIDDMLREPGC